MAPGRAQTRSGTAFQRGREAAALLLFTGALYTSLALLSFQGHPSDLSIHGPDWVGPVGESWARLLVSSVGIAAWYVPFELGLLVWPLFKNRASIATIARIAGDTLVVLIGASLVHVASPHAVSFGAMPTAGNLGELFGEVMRSLFSTVGSFLVGLAAIGLVLIGRASFSFISWAEKATRGTEMAAAKAASGARAVADAWEKASELRKAQAAATQALPPADEEPSIHDTTPPEATLFASSETPVDHTPAPILVAEVPSQGLRLDPTPSAPIAAAIDASKVAARPKLSREKIRPSDRPATHAPLALPAAQPVAVQAPPAAANLSPNTANENENGGPNSGQAAPKRTRRKRSAQDGEQGEPAENNDASAANESPQVNAENNANALERERLASAITVHDHAGQQANNTTTHAELADVAHGDSLDVHDNNEPPLGQSIVSPSAPIVDENPTADALDAQNVLLIDGAVVPKLADPEPSPEPVRAAPVEKRVSEKPAVEKLAAPAIQPMAVAPTLEKRAPKPLLPRAPLFVLPPTDYLDPAPENVPRESKEDLLTRARDLERVLANYGVKGAVVDIHTGPTVSTFEVVPAEGTKVSKVAGLSDDLALGLSCKVRIIAPIPGKNRIGFELPNRERIPVSLRELIEDDRFQRMNAPLPVVLGRDIVGGPFFADLASMPHVIVAGATGAGKSVGLNVMLTSLLYRRTPEELRLLMVDPKVVELAPFDKIPHMLLPVVTDMKQASNALKWAVDEMERRYQLFANAGTKNIGTYNGWVERAQRGEIKGFAPPKTSVATLESGAVVEAGPEREAPALPEKLPYIVIVVDEFADLMMQQGKEVEVSVARLAQKARAAGMHVILATQRPSVDVITGMIKANFPSRIGFKVAQRIDSRTILDEMGADQLLGRGDMLVKLNGVNETRRVQCPFVSEDEVHRVMDFIRSQGEPVYDESILKSRDDEESSSPDEDAELDPKYDEALRLVAETRRCSASWLQRKLGVGYNRAAKIVETMEKRGVVGGANGSKEREVLIAPL